MLRTIIIAAWVAAISMVAADLPIHCLSSQVAGTWEFSLGSADSPTPDLCGYRQPDKSKHHLDGSYRYTLSPVATTTVSLTLPNVVASTGPHSIGNGTWTMVYDEGFMLTMTDGEFFAFNAYKPKKGTMLSNIKPERYISFCDRTLIGWFRRGDRFGCWQGRQTKPAYPNLRIAAASANSAEVDFAVVAPDSLPNKNNHNHANAATQRGPVSPFPSLLQMGSESTSAASASARALDELFNPNYALIEAVNKDPSALYAAAPYAPFLGKTNREMLNLVGGLPHSGPSQLPRSAPSTPVTSAEIEQFAAFLQLEEEITTRRELSSNSKTAEQLAAEAEADAEGHELPVFLQTDESISVNTEADTEAEAESEAETVESESVAFAVAQDAEDLALLQAHGASPHRTKIIRSRASARAAQRNAANAAAKAAAIKAAAAANDPRLIIPGKIEKLRSPDSAARAGNATCEYGLPCALDWRNHRGHNWLSSIHNQGSCGACYAMAFMAAMEARVRIKRNQPTRHRYSAQHVLSCSQYNQGCDGGFPELVGLHVQHFGAVSEKCYPYAAQDGFCRQTCKHEEPEKPIQNTRYVGGYYGNTSEEAMMKEIATGGPIVVAFESPHGLFSYHGGIFTGPKPRAEDQGVPGAPLWQHTNHAVTAVGWGHTMVQGKREKYWVMMNSWGKNWGEEGFFRIRRGTDECAIESMAVSFDVKDGAF